MKQYLDIVERIMKEGEVRDDRTKVGTKSIFRATISQDLSKGFPLMTHKKVGIKTVAAELLWFMSGRTDVTFLQQLNCNIWNEWADKDGQLGPVYGEQWRGQYDQLANVIKKIMDNPTSRRLLVTSWNPSVEPEENLKPSDNPAKGKQALPPCHYAFQFYVTNSDVVHLEAKMRSNDFLLGNPFNLASYALLLHLVCYMTGKQVGTVYLDTADTHIYASHIECGGVDTILSRKDDLYELPTLTLDLPDEFKLKDSTEVAPLLDKLKDVEYSRQILDKIASGLSGYKHHPAVKFPVAV